MRPVHEAFCTRRRREGARGTVVGMDENADDSDGRTITVSAVLLRDESGNILTVRKRGTSAFMLPGGKPDQGESPAETALREAEEELGVRLDPHALEPLLTCRAPAANEPGYTVVASVFTHPPVPVPGVSAEIAELRWLDLDEPLPQDLAPMLVDHVLPALAEQVSAAQPGGRRAASNGDR